MPAAVVIGAAFATIVVLGNRWEVLRSANGLGAALTWVTLRSAALVGLAALGGFAISMALRYTAAALGAVLAYTLVGEAVLRVVWSGCERYLLSNHLFGFLLGKWTVEVWPDFCAGRCRPEVFRFDLGSASIYLSLVTGVVLAISYVVFRRRDVA